MNRAAMVSDRAADMRAPRTTSRVLYTSGDTDDAIVQHGVLKPRIDLIHKPLTPTQLLVKAREVLDRPREHQAP